jgi:hypothetical protein
VSSGYAERRSCPVERPDFCADRLDRADRQLWIDRQRKRRPAPAVGGGLLRTPWPWMVEREQLLRDVDAALDRAPRVRAGEPTPLGIDRPSTIEYVGGFGEPRSGAYGPSPTPR